MAVGSVTTRIVAGIAVSHHCLHYLLQSIKLLLLHLELRFESNFKLGMSRISLSLLVFDLPLMILILALLDLSLFLLCLQHAQDLLHRVSRRFDSRATRATQSTRLVRGCNFWNKKATHINLRKYYTHCMEQLMSLTQGQGFETRDGKPKDVKLKDVKLCSAFIMSCPDFVKSIVVPRT